MATGTAVGIGLMAAGAATSTAMSLKQATEGRERQREAEKALDTYQRQSLENVYAGMTVPMEGFRMREEQVKQQQALQTQLLSRAGARGLIGGLPAMQQQSQMAMRQIGADLEQSQFRIQQMIAQDEARIQQMQERREEQDIAGLGAEVGAGRQQYYQGMQGIGQSLGGIGTTVLGAQAAGLFDKNGEGTGTGGAATAAQRTPYMSGAYAPPPATISPLVGAPQQTTWSPMYMSGYGSQMRYSPVYGSPLGPQGVTM